MLERALSEALGTDRYVPVGDRRPPLLDRGNRWSAFCVSDEEPQFQLCDELLTFEEMDRWAGLFWQLGEVQVRLAGGKWLFCCELCRLVAVHPKEEGDLINTSDFVRPARTMLAVGG